MQAMGPVEALQRLGGVATFGELLGLTTRAQLIAALDAGRVLKPRHNRYSLIDLDQARRAAVQAGGVLSP